MNTWIELKRKDGTLDALYAHWVMGRDAAPPRRAGRSSATSCTGWSRAGGGWGG